MFTRLKTVCASGRTYQYVQLVENRRENGQVRQRLIASLGRLDQLLDKGDLEQVVKGLVIASEPHTAERQGVAKST